MEVDCLGEGAVSMMVGTGGCLSLIGGGGGDVPFSAVVRRVVRFLGASVEVEASGAAFLLRLLAAFGVGSSGASSFRLFLADRLGVA